MSWPMRGALTLTRSSALSAFSSSGVGVILLEDLHEAGDRAQRRAQVVRHRVAERLELAIGGAQFRGCVLDTLLELGARLGDPLRHGVEGIGEPADLVVAADLDRATSRDSATASRLRHAP